MAVRLEYLGQFTFRCRPVFTRMQQKIYYELFIYCVILRIFIPTTFCRNDLVLSCALEVGKSKDREINPAFTNVASLDLFLLIYTVCQRTLKDTGRKQATFWEAPSGWSCIDIWAYSLFRLSGSLCTWGISHCSSPDFWRGGASKQALSMEPQSFCSKKNILLKCLFGTSRGGQMWCLDVLRCV